MYAMDDKRFRDRTGIESDSQPAEKDIASTRRGMLGAKVLNAERFGVVKVQAKVAGGTLPELERDSIVTIRGVERQFRSPVKMGKMTERITASGSFKILQSDFGMQPFRVLAGALAVKDELKIQYRIEAGY
jgi:polyisoprenoid-binding protein YceI